METVTVQFPASSRTEVGVPVNSHAHHKRGRHFSCVLVCTHTTFAKGRSIFSRWTGNGPAFPQSSRFHRRSASPLPTTTTNNNTNNAAPARPPRRETLTEILTEILMEIDDDD